MTEMARDALEDFFENAPFACRWVSPGGTILRANRAELDLLGYDRDEYLGRNVADLFADPVVAADLLARVGRDEVIRDFPARLRAKDGSVKEVLIDSSAYTPHGRYVHTRSVTRDVTALSAAREARARLAAIVESSDDAIVSKTLQGVVTSWNRAAERLFGYTAAEAIGRSILFLIPLDRYTEETEILGRISRGERVHHFETIRLRKDGTPLDISLTVSPVRDEEGRIIGASKIARDITHQRRIERERAELLESEREARQIAETLNEVGRALAGELEFEPLLQIVVDAASRLTGAECGAFTYDLDAPSGPHTLYTLCGLPREAFTALRDSPLLAATFRGEGPIRIDDVRQDARFGEVRVPAAESAPPLVSYLAVPVVSRARKVLGGLFLWHPVPGRFRPAHVRGVESLAAQVAIAMDNARLYRQAQDELAGRRRAEEETRALNAVLETRVQDRTRSLEEMVRELDTFAYTVAHDLRAPLRAVHTFGQMLLEEAASKLDEEERGWVDLMVRAGGRMDRLIQDLLAYSRISRDRVPLEAVDLDAVVRSAIAEVEEETGRGKAHLAVEGPLPPVLGHTLTLSQAVLNLLRNAVKFVAPGTTPRVRVWAEDDVETVRLWVEDNGIGIPPEYHDKLFRIFERLHGRDDYPGTGVGLAIVRRGVERMGGRVGVVSEPWAGSRFFVDLRKPSASGIGAPTEPSR